MRSVIAATQDQVAWRPARKFQLAATNPVLLKSLTVEYLQPYPKAGKLEALIVLVRKPNIADARGILGAVARRKRTRE